MTDEITTTAGGAGQGSGPIGGGGGQTTGSAGGGQAPAATTAPPAAAATTTTTTPPPAGAAGGQQQQTQPSQGVTLTGKDDTGAGDGAQPGGTRQDAGGKPPAGDGGGEIRITHREGFTPLPEVEARLIDYAKTNGLDQAKTQALADLHMDAIQAMGGDLTKRLAETKQAFAREIEADPDFGGANLARTRDDANRGIKHFAPELIDKLKEWNLEMQPDIVRHFARLGRSLRENRSPGGDNPNQHRQRTLADDKEEMLADEARSLMNARGGP